jgi:hypothetical protein
VLQTHLSQKHCGTLFGSPNAAASGLPRIRIDWNARIGFAGLSAGLASQRGVRGRGWQLLFTNATPELCDENALFDTVFDDGE